MFKNQLIVIETAYRIYIKLGEVVEVCFCYFESDNDALKMYKDKVVMKRVLKKSAWKT